MDHALGCTLKQTGVNHEETNSDDRAWCYRYARHSHHHFIRAKRSSNRWLPASGWRCGWQSRFYRVQDAQWADRETADHEAPWSDGGLGADVYVLRRLSGQLLTAPCGGRRRRRCKSVVGAFTAIFATPRPWTGCCPSASRTT